MRGKLRFLFSQFAQFRITPADAGKTPAASASTSSAWDHPRGCGENVFARHSGISGVGSPPRMRGKPAPATDSRDSVRITPADAGKTRNRACAARQARDHPRGCGENLSAGITRKSVRGSPPRMRGKLHPTEGTLSAFRITPADAGKTCNLVAVQLLSEDHPRGCGENKYPDFVV